MPGIFPKVKKNISKVEDYHSHNTQSNVMLKVQKTFCEGVEP